MGNISPIFWCNTPQDNSIISIIIDKGACNNTIPYDVLKQQSNEIVISPLNLNDSIIKEKKFIYDTKKDKSKKINNKINLDDYLMNSGFITIPL
jgi:hypothetical protein